LSNIQKEAKKQAAAQRSSPIGQALSAAKQLKGQLIYGTIRRYSDTINLECRDRQQNKAATWLANLKPNLLHDCFPWLAAQALIAAIYLGFTPLCHAQDTKGGGTPLDTLLQTKLWADVPEAQDFVRETRPPPDSLSYQPLTGTDPERPKLRTKEELKALESELEQAAKHNLKSAGKRVGVSKPASTAKTAAHQ
jgi:hypothetical protein